jgi:hypothetical protein
MSLHCNSNPCLCAGLAILSCGLWQQQVARQDTLLCEHHLLLFGGGVAAGGVPASAVTKQLAGVLSLRGWAVAKR